MISRKLLFTLLSILASTAIYAQSNTFPTTGNVGIGTTSPTSPLNLQSTTGSRGLVLNLTGSPGGSHAPFILWDSRNGGGSYLFGMRQSGDNWHMKRYTDYWTGKLDIMTIKGATGYMGLGTTNPARPLDIRYGTAGNTDARLLRLTDSGATDRYDFSLETDDFLRLNNGTNGNVLMSWSKNGNIGIGTDNPTQKMTIDSNGNVYLRVSKSFYSDFFDFGITSHYADISYTAGTSTDSNIRLRTNGTTRMTVRHDGNVGIGIDAPLFKLDVLGNLRMRDELSLTYGLSSFVTGSGGASIYRTVDGGTAYPFQEYGSLILQSRSNANRDIAFVTGATPATRMVIDHQGHVGIGTTTPSEKLEVDGAIKVGTLVFESGEITRRVPSWTHPEHTIMKSAFKSGIGDYLFLGSAGNNVETFNAGLMISDLEGLAFGRADTDGSGLSSRVLVVNHSGNMGLGTETPTEKLEVIGNALVDGEIYSKKVKVSATPGNWPDYVFDASYNLMPLSQVEAFIKANKHLPEVPSAKEVEENGQDLGEIQATLLKKMEEITLYMIEMKKEVEALKEENARLKETVNKK